MLSQEALNRARRSGARAKLASVTTGQHEYSGAVQSLEEHPRRRLVMLRRHRRKNGNQWSGIN
jgi:hypothetical protein